MRKFSLHNRFIILSFMALLLLGVLALAPQNTLAASQTATSNHSTSTLSLLSHHQNHSVFSPKQDIGVGSLPLGAAVGDFNHDGKPDLAVIDSGSNSFNILLGTL